MFLANVLHVIFEHLLQAAKQFTGSQFSCLLVASTHRRTSEKSLSILISSTTFLLNVITSAATMFDPIFQFSSQLLQALRLGFIDSFVFYIFRLCHISMIGHDTIVIHHLIRSWRNVWGVIIRCSTKDRRTRPWVVIARQLFPECRTRWMVRWNRYGVGWIAWWFISCLRDALIATIPELIAFLCDVGVIWRCYGWVWLTLLLLFLILLFVGGIRVFFDGIDCL